MSKPSIQFRDTIGACTIEPNASPAFGNWTPGVDEFGDRQIPQATGVEEFWRYRRDFTASFEIAEIPASDLTKLIRLKSHLLTGGAAVVFTNDAASRVYTCTVKPGETPSWEFSDRAGLFYTLSAALKCMAPIPMLCDYSGYGGTSLDKITNGSGESGTVGSQATGWTKTDGNGLLIATDDYVLGSHSLKTAHTDDESSSSGQSGIAVTAGQRWLLSGWIRTTALTDTDDMGASLNLAQDATAAWTIVKGASSSPGLAADGSAYDWTYVYALVDITTSGTVKVACTLDTDGAGTAWWNNVRFERVEAA